SALLERRINVAARELLRHNPQFREDGAGKSGNPELQALEVVDRVDLLAEPAAHLGAGIAGREGDEVVLLEEVVEEIDPTQLVHPGILKALVEAEGHRRGKGEGRILSPVIVGCGVGDLDGAVAYRICG